MINFILFLIILMKTFILLIISQLMFSQSPGIQNGDFIDTERE